MASASRLVGLVLVLCASSVVVHCSSEESTDAGAGAVSPVGDAGRDEVQAMPDVMAAPDSGALEYHENCGVVVGKTCVPDDATSCGTAGAPPTSSGGGGESAGGMGAGGAAGEGSGAVSGGGGAAGDGGSGGANGGQGGESFTAGQGGTPNSGSGGSGEPSAQQLACQVVPLATGPKATCRAAGTGKAKSPCFSTQQCEPGLACVKEGEGKICLPFCCAGDDSCTHGTYCAERLLADDPDELLEVPVCVAAADCNLNEPYPCTGTSCTCDDPRLACMVVRADGTTTCAEPGSGKVGDACPCAWGHVCSQASETCVLLCETARPDYYCGNEKCQASAELPDGWGVCVLPEPDAAAAR